MGKLPLLKYNCQIEENSIQVDLIIYTYITNAQNKILFKKVTLYNYLIIKPCSVYYD